MLLNERIFEQVILEYSRSIYQSDKNHDPSQSRELLSTFINNYWCTDNIKELINKSILQNYKVGGIDIKENLDFKDKYNVYIDIGGATFTEFEYLEFQKTLAGSGSSHFYIFENPIPVEFGLNRETVNVTFPVSLKIPVDTAWSELIKGGPISNVLLGNFPKEFFVFGDKLNFGKYCSNDLYCLDIYFSTRPIVPKSSYIGKPREYFEEKLRRSFPNLETAHGYLVKDLPPQLRKKVRFS